MAQLALSAPQEQGYQDRLDPEEVTARLDSLARLVRLEQLAFPDRWARAVKMAATAPMVRLGQEV